MGRGAGSEKSRTNLHSVEKGGVQIIMPRSAFRAVIANLRPLTEKEKLNCIAGVVNLRKVFIYTLKEAADFFEHFLSFKQFFPNINSLKKHITMWKNTVGHNKLWFFALYTMPLLGEKKQPKHVDKNKNLFRFNFLLLQI